MLYLTPQVMESASELAGAAAWHKRYRPTNSVRTAAIVAVLLLVLQSGSSAAVTKAFSVSNWLGSVTFNDKTKQFENCSASSTNKTGITISYAVDRQFTWKLAFSSAAWDFTAGPVFSVSLKIEDEEFRGERAIVTGNRTIELQLTDPITLFQRLRLGQSLHVRAGGLTFMLDLRDTDEVLPALVRCATQQTGRTPQAKGNSRAAKPLPAASSDLSARAEAYALAEGILTRIGMTNSRFVGLNDVPSGYRAHTAWKSGTVIGTVTILPPAGALPLENFPRDILNTAGAGCRGRFFLIAAPDNIDQTPVARIFSSCEMAQGTISTFHLAIPRAAGGLYLFGTINEGTEIGLVRPAEDIDRRIRRVVIGVATAQSHDQAAPEP